MKVKLYIVTYRNLKRVSDNLTSLKQSKFFDNPSNEVFILNNSPSVFLADLVTDRIHIIDNVLRPETSIAHLTRSWNQCLVNGFQNLNQPDCDILITSQDDVVFNHDWYDAVMSQHQTYDLITFGPGDMVCSYTTNAVKKAGIWDEHFLGLGWHESEYFQRSLMWNKERTSINDGHMHLHLNWQSLPQMMTRTQIELEAEHRRSEMWDYNHEYFKEKWPTLRSGNCHVEGELITLDYIQALKPTVPNIPIFRTYHVFEKDIEDVAGKGYFNTIIPKSKNDKARSLRSRWRPRR